MLPSKLSEKDEMDQLHDLLTHLSGRLDRLPVRYRKSISKDIEKLKAFLKDGPLFREGSAIVFEESPSLDGAVFKIENNLAVSSSGQPPARVEAFPQFDLLQTIFQANPSGLAVVTVPDLVCRITNQSYRAMMPDPTIDPIEKSLDQLWPENDLTEARALFHQIVDTGEGIAGRYQQNGADEEGNAVARWFSVRVEPIEWRQQPAVLLVLWETTQLEQALQEIQAQKERLRQAGERLAEVLESITDIYFALDQDWRFIEINSQAERYVFLRPANELIGQVFWEAIPQTIGTIFLKKYQEAVRENHPVHFEAKTLFTGRWVEIHVYPRKDRLEIYGRDITEQREYLTQMEVQRRLAEHRELERQNIAREIHDGPIQSLVSTLFHLQRVKEDMNRPGVIANTGGEVSNPAIPFELEQVTQSLKSTVQELRMVINDLRPPSLLQFGLTRVIQIHVEDLRERFPQLEIHLNLFDDRYLLSKQVCLELYRVYQESLNNVIRHAQASQVWVRYFMEEQQIVLEIRDNGRGFILPADWVTFPRSNHFGMAGMKERIEAIGGEFAPWSEPEKGTIVRIRVPVGKTGLEPATSSV